MSKLAIIFGVVLFASAGNAFSWTETMQGMQKNVQQITDTVIMEIETLLESTKSNAVTKMVEIEDNIKNFHSKMTDEVSSITNNFQSQLNELCNGVDEAIVKECVKSDDKKNLNHLSEAVMKKTDECTYNKFDNGILYVQTISDVATKALTEMKEVKEKAQHCADDVSDSKSSLFAILCSKSTAASAAWISMKAAPQLTTNWTKLKFLLVTLQPSLNLCNKDERMNLQQESSTLLKNAKECVKQKVDQNAAHKVHKSEEDFA